MNKALHFPKVWISSFCIWLLCSCGFLQWSSLGCPEPCCDEISTSQPLGSPPFSASLTPHHPCSFWHFLIFLDASVTKDSVSLVYLIRSLCPSHTLYRRKRAFQQSWDSSGRRQVEGTSADRRYRDSGQCHTLGVWRWRSHWTNQSDQGQPGTALPSRTEGWVSGNQNQQSFYCLNITKACDRGHIYTYTHRDCIK